jgi:hypothetical protein
MVPSVDPNKIFNRLSRESTICRDAVGRWFHDGERVEHPMVAHAFDRWIGRADDGRYCLNNGIDWVYIALDGPPLFVRSLRIQDDNKVFLLLSNDTEQKLDLDTLRQGEDGALYCEIGDVKLVAKFDRHAMAQLAELVEEDTRGVYIQLGEQRVRPPTVADPLGPFSHSILKMHKKGNVGDANR